MAISGATRAIVSFEGSKWKGLKMKICELGDNNNNNGFAFGFGLCYTGVKKGYLDAAMIFNNKFISNTGFSFYIDSSNTSLVNESKF